MISDQKQSLGLFEAFLIASVLAVAVFVSFYLFSDIRQPETVRLTYLGMENRIERDEPSAERQNVRACLDSDLPCLPSSLEATLFASRPPK